MVSTETSPLLDKPAAVAADIHKVKDFFILVEVIGTRFLPANSSSHVFCVLKYGGRTIHRTRPFVSTRQNSLFHWNRSSTAAEDKKRLENPIWTIQHDALTTVMISPRDFENKKALTIAVYGKQQQPSRALPRRRAERARFVGKCRFKSPSLLEQCTEERIEVTLTDDLGRPIVGGVLEQSALLACRFRVASNADVTFIQQQCRGSRWHQHNWKGTDVLPHPTRPRAVAVTELDEKFVPGASFKTAVAGTKRRVKPYPDPMQQPQQQLLTRPQMKERCQDPSRNWIAAGTYTGRGRIYVEILSCHNLPNVDYGSGAGNKTDAFVTAVYGDTVVQSDIIDDELSPVWLPWTQRAFCLEMQQHASSQVLYLAIFGFKRTPLLQHKAVGRVGINIRHFQCDTLYNLVYPLQLGGTVRIRLRVEMDQERAVLLNALRPPPAVHVNVRQKKSVPVLRYTCCGEENDEIFSMSIFQGYVDEILEGFVPRLLYAWSDAIKSLMLWRTTRQVRICGLGVVLPLYSFLAFVMGLFVVEYPYMFPAVLCLVMAGILLVNMQQRLETPSPWRRCFSFWHYLRILITGKSAPCYQTIGENEGHEEMRAQEDKLKARIDQDNEFFKMKEAVETEIEKIEQETVTMATKMEVNYIELMVVLVKVQRIVGGKRILLLWLCRLRQMVLVDRLFLITRLDFCRLLRSLDVIFTWEESDLSFWITAIFLVTGILFLFVPWAYLFRWTGRIAIVVFFGPQNKVLDVIWFSRHETVKHRIQKMLSERMFQARCHQEAARKLRDFRSILFGEFSILVPSIMTTRKLDFPLACSTAHVTTEAVPDLCFDSMSNLKLFVPGQTLWGSMVPRPKNEWLRNREESMRSKQTIDQTLLRKDEEKRESQPEMNDSSFEDYDAVGEEGVEVSYEMDDEEAGLVLPGLLESPESMRELGVEIQWDSLREVDVRVNEDNNDSSAEGTVKDGLLEEDNDADWKKPEESTADTVLESSAASERRLSNLGFEITELFDTEAKFVQQSWRESSVDSIREMSEEAMGLKQAVITSIPIEKQLQSDFQSSSDIISSPRVDTAEQFQIGDVPVAEDTRTFLDRQPAEALNISTEDCVDAFKRSSAIPPQEEADSDEVSDIETGGSPMYERTVFMEQLASTANHDDERASSSMEKAAGRIALEREVSTSLRLFDVVDDRANDSSSLDDNATATELNNSSDEQGGVEITETFDEEAQFVQKSWRASSRSVEESPVALDDPTSRLISSSTDSKTSHADSDDIGSSATTVRSSSITDGGFEVIEPSFESTAVD
jgi:hypothetical protein